MGSSAIRSSTVQTVCASPASVVLHEMDDNGIWVQDEVLHKELARLAKQPGIPDFLKRNPLVFLPLCRVEWIMVAASDAH